ncbi:DUF1097 domain-containing protein [Ensifer sp. NM-2]|uniref:DUF1097 domain-containing protein n=1 Tax=Ensifer sp. NM-2 TaxID=2109730 RepID=UPI0018EDE470|nr:DUF1097 domain-containing protein [Ensifer sp. NM-2]
MAAQTEPTGRAPSAWKFNLLTLVAATTAAVAATTSASVGWPVWAMFMGWVAFFTRGHTAREALTSYICLAVGIAIGMAAALALRALMPAMGALAFGPVVFVVAMIVVSLRATAPVNNVPAYFLGLIILRGASGARMARVLRTGWCRRPRLRGRMGGASSAGGHRALTTTAPAQAPGLSLAGRAINTKGRTVRSNYWLTAPAESRDWWRCQSSACTSA